MVRKTIQALTTKISSLHEAAFWLSLFALFSQLLALLRDRLLAHHFGAGEVLDIYYAAFKIPDLLFVTVASLVSISALVPLFARKETEGEKHLKDATASIFTVFSVFIILSCIIAWFLMPHIVEISFPGFGESAQKETAFLSRILLLSPLLLGFSNFFGSIVQYEKRFILYSVSPLFYNFGIISGIIFLIHKWGIEGVVFGVVLGCVLHLLVQSIFVIFSKTSLRPKFTFDIKWRDVWETAYLSVPRTLALSVVSFVGLFFISIASVLQEGSIAVFNFSWNLQSAPLSLIGVSFSLAAFPTLAVSAAKKDTEDVILKISDGLKQIIFWSLPATALIIILRAHIVRVVLGSGNFNWSDTRLTAAVLSIFVLSTVFQSIGLFLSRSHYALHKTKLPLIGNIAGGIVSVALAFLFLKQFNSFNFIFKSVASLLNVSDLPKTILLIPLAYSLGTLVTAAFLFWTLGSELKVRIWKNISRTFIQSLLASVAAGVGAYIALSIFDGVFNLEKFWGVLGHGFFGGVGGIIVGVVALAFMKNKEYRNIISRFKNK